MREFKISEVEKTKILEELNKQLKYYQHFLEREVEIDDDIEYIEEIKNKVEQIKQEEKRLNQDNTITQRIFRLIDSDINIELTPEMQDILQQDITEETRDILEDTVKKRKY